jgi:L-amino acid N-acyltransferase YncA
LANSRLMTPADYPAVAAIANDAAERALVGLPTWETAEDVATEIASLRHSEFIVAEDEEGKILGLAGYALQEQGAAAIYGPLVVEEGHGVGAWLASRIESMALRHGATNTSMLIGLDNGSGVEWVEWRGYQRDSEHPQMLLTWIYPGELNRTGQLTDGQVRPAVTAYLERINELYETCMPTGQDSPETWATWLDECYVLEIGGKVQGFVHLIASAATVRLIGIDPAQRRHGAGTRLLADALEAVWAGRPQKMGAAVRLDNKATTALLRHLGFRREIPVGTWMKREG